MEQSVAYHVQANKLQSGSNFCNLVGRLHLEIVIVVEFEWFIQVFVQDKLSDCGQITLCRSFAFKLSMSRFHEVWLRDCKDFDVCCQKMILSVLHISIQKNHTCVMNTAHFADLFPSVTLFSTCLWHAESPLCPHFADKRCCTVCDVTTWDTKKAMTKRLPHLKTAMIKAWKITIWKIAHLCASNCFYCAITRSELVSKLCVKNTKQIPSSCKIFSLELSVCLSRSFSPLHTFCHGTNSCLGRLHVQKFTQNAQERRMWKKVSRVKTVTTSL